MFEKAATRTAKTIYALAIGVGVIWLAWLCLTHFSAWMAVLMFCLGLPLLGLIAAPIAAGGALLAGIAVGLAVTVSAAFVRRVRSAG